MSGVPVGIRNAVWKAHSNVEEGGAPLWTLQQELTGKGVVSLRGPALVKISSGHKNRKACNAMEKQYSAVGERLGWVWGHRLLSLWTRFERAVVREI